MSDFKEGVRLKTVAAPADANGNYFHISSGISGCKQIVVSMQPGQMAMVPWARAEKDDGSVTMINLALMEIVVLEEPHNE